MIVGRGSLASILTDREGAIFFASGVSNSRCEDLTEFNRERHLLSTYWGENMTESLFYFSSISINFIDTPYTRHKLQMEKHVREWFKNYNIIRIGNIEGDTNPNTFVNYIKARQWRGLSVEIKDEYRYMIDQKTLTLITQSLPLVGQNEITVTSTVKKVKDYL